MIFRFPFGRSVQSSPVKTIYRAEWLQKEQGELEFCIEGNGFLYHMVRNIVWHLVEVGKGTKVLLHLKVNLQQASVILRLPRRLLRDFI